MSPTLAVAPIDAPRRGFNAALWDRRMAELGLTRPSDQAAALGVARSTLNRIRRGVVSASAPVLWRMTHLTALDLDDLFPVVGEDRLKPAA